MQVKLNNLGNAIESRIFADSKSRRGFSTDRIVEEIVIKHYMSQVELSEIISYDATHGVVYNSSTAEKVKLTNKENSLLELLSRNKNSVVATELIYSHVWNGGEDFNKEDFKFTLRNMILKIRRKLGNTVNIKNKSGVGYILAFSK